jgi:hypothetical protein
MGALSWVRLTRRLPGVVRQRELVNLEALIDAEAGRQPYRNLFILSCAIPAVVATFGGLSILGAWIAGNRGLPLLVGTMVTALLSAGSWFVFYRLYRDIPPSRRHLRDQIAKFSQRYASFGNIFLGEQLLLEPFASMLDEAAGIYLRHRIQDGAREGEAPTKALSAIEQAMSKLMEVALLPESAAQTQAIHWAQPMLEEMRLLDDSLTERAIRAAQPQLADPLANLRSARAELHASTTAIQELDQDLSGH